jgi:hypothetical protein
MTRHNESPIPIGAARGDLSFFNESNLYSLLRKIIRGTNSNHPAADDHDILLRIHANIYITMDAARTFAGRAFAAVSKDKIFNQTK